MGSSTITIQSVVDYAKTFPDIQAVLTAGGYSLQPALTIAIDTVNAMLTPAFPFKWNRFNVAPFYTNAFQQDYAVPGVNNLNWIEHAFLVDINRTSQPKPIFMIEAVRDLERAFNQYGRPGQICWLPNDQLVYDVWPGTGITYSNPVSVVVSTNNPITQIKDPNGNLQVVIEFGTTGTPAWPAAKASPGVLTTDGTVTWMVVDPKGQGFRLNSIPSQGNVIFQVNVVGQMEPPIFTSLSNTLDPLPDEYATHFRQGFIAECYRHSPDPNIRGKFAQEYAIWMQTIKDTVKEGDRERDAAGFYPTCGIMDSGFYGSVGPGNPYGGF